MPPSEHIFKEITSVAVFAGIVCITCKLLTKRRIFYGFIFLLTAIVLFILSFVLISSIFWKFSEGGPSNFTLGIMYSYGTVLAIYYLANGERIATHLQDLLELKEIFSACSGLCNLHSFERILEPHAIRLNAWIKLQFWLNFLALPANFVYKAMSRVKMVDFGNENDLVHAVYFDTTDDALFWPTVIFQCVSLHTMVVMQTVNDLYILNVTLLLVLFFRYLRHRLGAVVNWSRFSFKPVTHSCKNENLTMFSNPMMSMKYSGRLKHSDKLNLEVVDKDIKFWIQYHTHLLRLCRDFIQLYTPVLVAYFINVFLSVSFGTFIVTQCCITCSEDDPSDPESDEELAVPLPMDTDTSTENKMFSKLM
ncbi:hypothetical protein J6590_006978 [Homalodisca vitripennis]|nr:hypothetical protein J6590_006978 [Homalodisca vitripennis]